MFEFKKCHLHVVLNEPLEFGISKFLLSKLNTALFKFVSEVRWAEQDNSPEKHKLIRKQRQHATKYQHAKKQHKSLLKI